MIGLSGVFNPWSDPQWVSSNSEGFPTLMQAPVEGSAQVSVIICIAYLSNIRGSNLLCVLVHSGCYDKIPYYR
jgi:hypothetical protein